MPSLRSSDFPHLKNCANDTVEAYTKIDQAIGLIEQKTPESVRKCRVLQMYMYLPAWLANWLSAYSNMNCNLFIIRFIGYAGKRAY